MKRLMQVIGAVVVVLGVSVGVTTAAGASSGLEIAGRVRESHGDDFSHGHEVDEHYALETAGGVVKLDVPEGIMLTPGQQARLRGHYDHGKFVVADAGSRPGGGDVAAAAVSGNKNVAVLLFNFTNDTSQPWTTSTVRNVVFDSTTSVNAYYQDASNGSLTLSGNVFGWYTIGMDNSGCQYDNWGTAARNAATAAGVPLSSYQYIVYAFPSTASCGWAGLAYLPGTGAWINGSMTLRVVAHELGHNFGVHHASTLDCTNGSTRVTLSGNCTMNEYGDPFSVMGSAATRLHNNWHRTQLGFNPAGQVVSTSGDYLLAPADGSGSPRMLSIARPDGTYFQLEFRQPTGLFDNFSPSDPVVNGVSIRIAPAPNVIIQSKLLDATPETATFADAALPVGRSFVDPGTGLQITTKAVGPSGATVGIQFVPDTQPPSTPPGLTATPKSSSSIGLAWGASSDNVGVAYYRVYRGATLLGTTTALTYTDSGLSASTLYSYQVVAVDTSGLASTPASASATTMTVDTQAPTTPTNLRATVSKGRTVSLTWTASTDNVGVAGYRVYRGGVLDTTVSSTSATDRPGRGTFTYTVVAYDANGNVSGSAGPLTVNV
ncbi:MAG: hypothetical protein E6G14_16340 [Actinobacteria bacterium]|nr:MAG: hypothetical protein E6G14_16340 [Actinomycetota bacterium]